jgi:hypothetical protein
LHLMQQGCFGICFMVARESGTFQAHQERLLTAIETDTLITSLTI